MTRPEYPPNRKYGTTTIRSAPSAGPLQGRGKDGSAQRDEDQPGRRRHALQQPAGATLALGRCRQGRGTPADQQRRGSRPAGARPGCSPPACSLHAANPGLTHQGRGRCGPPAVQRQGAGRAAARRRLPRPGWAQPIPGQARRGCTLPSGRREHRRARRNIPRNLQPTGAGQAGHHLTHRGAASR